MHVEVNGKPETFAASSESVWKATLAKAIPSPNGSVANFGALTVWE